MKKIVTKLGNSELIIETGRMAKQADGACTVQLGGTIVLVAAVCSGEPREGIDFFPLTCEYQEKTTVERNIASRFQRQLSTPHRTPPPRSAK